MNVNNISNPPSFSDQKAPKSCLKKLPIAQGILKKTVQFDDTKTITRTVSKWIQEDKISTEVDNIEKMFLNLTDTSFKTFRDLFKEKNKPFQRINLYGKTRLLMLCTEFTSLLKSHSPLEPEQKEMLFPLYEVLASPLKSFEKEDVEYHKALHKLNTLMVLLQGPSVIRNENHLLSLFLLADKLENHFPKVVEEYTKDTLYILKMPNDWSQISGTLSHQEKARVLLALLVNEIYKSPEEAYKKEVIQSIYPFFAIALHPGRQGEPLSLCQEELDFINEVNIPFDKEGEESLLYKLREYSQIKTDEWVTLPSPWKLDFEMHPVEQHFFKALDISFPKFRKLFEYQNSTYPDLAKKIRLRVLCIQFTFFLKSLPSLLDEQKKELIPLYEILAGSLEGLHKDDITYYNALHALNAFMVLNLGPSAIRSEDSITSFLILWEKLEDHFEDVISMYHRGILPHIDATHDNSWERNLDDLPYQTRALIALDILIDYLSKNWEEAERKSEIKNLCPLFAIAMHPGKPNETVSISKKAIQFIEKYKLPYGKEKENELLQKLWEFYKDL